MRLEARQKPSRLLMVLSPVIAVAVAFAICAVLVTLAGAPVGAAFKALYEGSLGSKTAICETLVKATPLIFTGLSVAIAAKAHFYNIGAEGQLYLGALAAVLVGGMHGGEGFDLPVWVLMPAMMLAAAVAGGLWLALSGWFKTRFKVDEVVTTLLCNFIIALLVSYLLNGPMKDPSGMGWPQTVALNPDLELSHIVAKTRLHSGLLIALAASVMVWAVQKYTTFGFRMRAIGEQAEASRFAGISVTRTTVYVTLISGALAGLAGAVEVAGRTSYLTMDMSPGFGYTGIVVAMLAGLNPLGVVLAAIFAASLFVGADTMSRAVGVPSYIVDVIVAVSMIAMMVSAMFARFRLRWR